jgi:Zn-dependent protease with chaperone function
VDYYLLLGIVVLAGFAAAAFCGALVTRLSWPRLHDWAGPFEPRRRTTIFFLARTLPLLAGVVSASLLAGSFVRFEPRQTSESAGVFLWIVALVGLWLGYVAGTRAIRTAARALWFKRLARDCRQQIVAGMPASIVESRYPVAAVLGIVKPRLLLSTRILKECPAEEIAAIVAHERAHVRHRDNLCRTAMVALPDPLGRLGPGSAIERAWSLAAEEAADREAGGGDEQRRAILAQALVRVASMAKGTPPPWMPALAFYQGHDLQRRIEALLGRPAEALAPKALASVGLTVLAALLTIAIVSADIVHAGLEWAVRFLP